MKILEKSKKKLFKILDEKIRPAVAKDGGDIKFKEFKDGVVNGSITGQLFWMSQFNDDT